jgi:hypothetical protein
MGCWDGKDDDGHHKPNNFQKSKKYIEKYKRRLLCLKLSIKKKMGCQNWGRWMINVQSNHPKIKILTRIA